jgi:hypothetical protein
MRRFNGFKLQGLPNYSPRIIFVRHSQKPRDLRSQRQQLCAEFLLTLLVIIPGRLLLFIVQNALYEVGDGKPLGGFPSSHLPPPDDPVEQNPERKIHFTG